MGQNRLKKLGLLIASALYGFVLLVAAYGHQEIDLRVEDSEITGLPDRYSPCVIDWDNNSLKIRDKALELPRLLSSFFKSERYKDKNGKLLLKAGIAWELKISASWFHQEEEKGALPEYLILSLIPINKGYRIDTIVNLETVSIVGVRVVLLTFSKEDDDVWVNDQNPLLGSVTSSEFELVVDEDAASVWEKNEGE